MDGSSVIAHNFHDCSPETGMMGVAVDPQKLCP